MRKIVKFFVVAIIAILCFAACGGDTYSVDVPYASYNVVGKIIDKETKEPVKDVMVILQLDLPTLQKSKGRLSMPTPKEGWSDADGYFQAYDFFTLASVAAKNDSLYVSFLNGKYNNKDVFYKDTIVKVDIKDAIFYNHKDKNYRGYYSLEMGEIELEKID